MRAINKELQEFVDSLALEVGLAKNSLLAYERDLTKVIELNSEISAKQSGIENLKRTKILDWVDEQYDKLDKITAQHTRLFAGLIEITL